MLPRRVGWTFIPLLVLALVGGPGAPPTYAAQFVVNTTADLPDLNPGDGVCDADAAAGQQCSLRAAVQTANALGGAHTIVLASTTYNLTQVGNSDDAAVQGDLDVHATITVVGRGQSATFIDGQKSSTLNADRVFDVQPNGKLILQQLTVQNGFALGFPGGGGVRVQGGALELAQVTVADSETNQNGGGIYAEDSAVVIRNSTLRKNTATNNGSGGLGQRSGTALLEQVTLTGNLGFHGGGCKLDNAQARFRNVTLSENQALQGAGCHFGGTGNHVQFEGGRVERNTAEGGGGGLVNETDSQLRLTGTTITRNTAANAGGVSNSAPGTVTFNGAHVNNNTPNNCVGTPTCPP
jgi:CSLREA domain-containing protein